MMPPIGAGVLALQCRQHDTELIDLVSGLGDRDAYRETEAERMFLHVLQGHCDSPIAGYAQVERGGELSLRATVFSPDGKVMIYAHEWAGRLDPATLGTSVAVSLLRQRPRVDRRHPVLSPPRGRSGEPRLPVRALAGTSLPRSRPSYVIGGGARRPLSVRARTICPCPPPPGLTVGCSLLLRGSTRRSDDSWRSPTHPGARWSTNGSWSSGRKPPGPIWSRRRSARAPRRLGGSYR
ncbi:porphobilinogen deaminase [Streptomyces turgidiscabies]|nr:porphobilinogen deaminase [Streptomyces turgidiscabies]